MRFVTNVPDHDVPYLDRGDPADVGFRAFPKRTFHGKVARTAGRVDPNSGTMRAEIDLDNSDGVLREGMSGQVTIDLDASASGLTISASAVNDGGFNSSPSCFRIVDGRAVLTPIKIALDDGVQVLVTEGLKEGDTVALDPAADGVKRDGQTVEVDQP
jgi:RND family efflux transporter MFP subunit